MRQPAVLLALFAAACAGAVPAAAPAPEEAARWRATGIADYSAELTVACMCVHRGEYRITVRGGLLSSAVTSAGAPVGARIRELLPTVDGLFAQAAESRARGIPAQLELDERLGYPRRAVFGTPENDAGAVYSLRGLAAAATTR